MNDMQFEAVTTINGPLLILAGAGSGKTTVLVNRIANLVKFGDGYRSTYCPAVTEEDIKAGEDYLNGVTDYVPNGIFSVHPVRPWQILAITFTNKAAGELKARLENMLGPEANDIWACTFHSACVRILRRDAEKLGFPSNFSIYDTSDSTSLIKHIIKDFNLDDKTYAPKVVLGAISRAKDQQIGAQEYLRQAKASGDLFRSKTGEIYAEYMRRMFAAGAMDFDDLIFFTVQLLQEHEDARTYWQRRFRYVLIDEYQDTNRLQYLLSSLLAGGFGNICVVGDDDL